MQSRPHLTYRLALFTLSIMVSLGTSTDKRLSADELASKGARMSPIVMAVAECQDSVVNIRGRKTIPVESSDSSKTLKQVNGMGTGVVIDSRGYVLTNYHVVEGVRKIEVTTSNREKTTAQLLAHDPETDLAILKIETNSPLPKIKVGTSSDLMLAEKVIAVGNAYGYEHTVTTGIISSLSRTVQVNDEQIYRNLIQTDAAINPGNSGGPLLNTNGEMIGINVAVRIGAQGIAFAIPVNDAIEVAADLLEELSTKNLYHGLVVRTQYVDDRAQLVISNVQPDSPAAAIGLAAGDRLVSIGGKPVNSRLDFNTALLSSTVNDKLEIKVSRDGEFVMESLAFSVPSGNEAPVVSASSLAWVPLGMKLTPASESELQNRHPNYKKGLRVVQVRPNSPADAEGIMAGDILVAMHGWKTESLENLAYILQRPDIAKQKSFMFYILRDTEPYWGQMRVANLPR